VLIAVVFALAGALEVAVAVGCAALIWLVTRAEIVDDPYQPGLHTRRRGQLGLVRVGLMFVIYATVGVAAFSIRDEPPSRPLTIAVFALAGLSYLMIRELQTAGDDALNWLIGSRAEQEVGSQLNALRERGWLVVHGYRRDERRDVDHIVCGPTGAYAIETKSGGFRKRDTHQATGNAAWLKQFLGIRWATGVLCVAEEFPPQKHGHAWVMGASHLVGWLEAQRNAPVDPETARQALLGR
jgi:hypothetical protein